jgi:hypothetical protein
MLLRVKLDTCGLFLDHVDFFSFLAAKNLISPSCSVSPERYRALLQLMVEGHQNMVRVWGGGIYEQDAFYDICDGKFFFVQGAIN